jgi:sulfide dehydrogenase cytochrome subunit
MKTVTKQSLSIAMGLALFAGVGSVAAEAPPAAENCVDCHTANGVSEDPMVPTIAGVGAFYLENQFALYNEEARPCAADEFGDHAAENHCTVVQNLSEDEQMALAEYYADQEFVAYEQEYDSAMAEQGAAIHEDNCARCHTAGGSEPFDDAGILAGQPIPYMTHQLELYNANERWQPESKAEVTTALDEQQIKALANFYAAEGLK